MRNDPETEMRDLMARGQTMIVVGTGVSIAATLNPATKSSHPQASWVGLLQHGLGWLKQHHLVDDELVSSYQTILNKNPRTHNLITVAQEVVNGMGGVGSTHYAKWLQETIGTIQAHNRHTIDALHALQGLGNILATTNYDELLLDDDGRLGPVTWREQDEVLRVMRQPKQDKVIFLHGHWRQPDTVILDWKSYEEIARDASYRDDFAAVWKTKTWVFVGAGKDGLTDPDFGLLLEKYGKRARQAELWDYCLVLQKELREFQAFFDKQKLAIKAVAYGADFGDLPGYLRGMLPASVATATPVPVAHTPATPSSRSNPTIPPPPAFCAVPKYLGSHKFVGRRRELEDLSDWAKAADPTNLLLFEAIGGNGKSMLTWEWATNRALTDRSDWAGRFWYSFYERGAVMADFCQHALAYMTGQPLEELRKLKTSTMTPILLAELHARPWLLVLDGLERVLVAYNRIDAPELPDEEADHPTDKIVNRDPCTAIREEDNELLRLLADAKPSKILVTSRLTPKSLLNPSGQPIPGAKRFTLPGLRPADAEELLRSCEITGDSAAMQAYLTENCDNHPLVIGILGGLIRNYMRDRGNFDRWVKDPDGGLQLNFAELDLIQRRNHILRAAIQDLEAPSAQLLATVSLLSESVDYETLLAFNPHLPSEPEEVEKPEPPEEDWDWDEDLSKAERTRRQKQYKADLKQWEAYEAAMQARLSSTAYKEAPKKLQATVLDLERRGLLQYEGNTQRYDLHPVVRGVAAGGLQQDDKQRYGQQVVDYFSARPHNPYDEAETLEEVGAGLQVIRTLLKLGHFQKAADAIRGGFSNALFFNLEAYGLVLSLLKPFFPEGWGTLPVGLENAAASYLANNAGVALQNSGASEEAMAAYSAALVRDIQNQNWTAVRIGLSNMAIAVADRLAVSARIYPLCLDLATCIDDEQQLFSARLDQFWMLAQLGEWETAEALWKLLDAQGRNWLRAVYRPGTAEWRYAQLIFWQGKLEEGHLADAERLAREGKGRSLIRYLHALRGEWAVSLQQWDMAAASMQEALRMAREAGLEDAAAEVGLSLAKYHLGQLPDARQEAERLSRFGGGVDSLAKLWLAIGDLPQAEACALRYYRWAWADGEPYVWRYHLKEATDLLIQLGVAIPVLPPYDARKDPKFPWEVQAEEAIAKLKAERAAKQGK